MKFSKTIDYLYLSNLSQQIQVLPSDEASAPMKSNGLLKKIEKALRFGMMAMMSAMKNIFSTDNIKNVVLDLERTLGFIVVR